MDILALPEETKKEKIIDALKTEEDIHNEILNHIESFMKKRGF